MARKVTIQGNRVHGNGGDGIQYPADSEAVVQANDVGANAGAGIVVAPTASKGRIWWWIMGTIVSAFIGVLVVGATLTVWPKIPH